MSTTDSLHLSEDKPMVGQLFLAYLILSYFATTGLLLVAIVLIYFIVIDPTQATKEGN